MSRPDKQQNESSDSCFTKCEEVQAALMEFMSRELSMAKSDVVREHLRKCPDCQKEAAAMREVVEVLKGASGTVSAPIRLSDDRRKRLWRALMHPILNWIYNHHTLVSVILTLIALIIGFLMVNRLPLPQWEDPHRLKPEPEAVVTPTVTIGAKLPEATQSEPPDAVSEQRSEADNNTEKGTPGAP